MGTILLSIDTSTRSAGLALYNGQQVICELVWQSKDHHTVELAPAVEEILDRSEVQVADIGAVAVSLGPGSFTGLRIGMALAKGLCIALRIPIIGIPTLDILAAAQPTENTPLISVLHAGRGRLVAGWYEVVDQTWKSTGHIEILTAVELAGRIQGPIMICGELTESERRVLGRKYKTVRLASPAQSVRRPAYLAELAWNRWRSGNVDDPATLVPIYLHFREPIPG